MSEKAQRESLRAYCERTGRDELLREWDAEKNAPLTPDTVGYGSKRGVWWRCDNGHEWQAAVFSRTYSTGCPICSGRKVIPGVNDLATLYPALAQEWSSRNGSLKPETLRPFSNKKVWWRCERGHEWQATPNARISFSSGCPICANRKLLPGFNDLKTCEPEIAAEWHPTLNGALTPSEVLCGSHRKAWWICREGHVWRTEIASRTGRKRPGCPLCAGNVSKKWREQYERELAAASAGVAPDPQRGAHGG